MVDAELSRSQNKNLVFHGRSSTIVPIHEDGSRRPLYLIHALRGEIDCYYALAHALGSDQPIYAFELTGLELEHPQGVDSIARAYVRDLRAFHPVGPYIIGGYSFGGNIAFEMAKLLSDEGEEPPMVLMFDSNVPASTQRVWAYGRGQASFGKTLEWEVSIISPRGKEPRHATGKRLLKGGFYPLLAQFFSVSANPFLRAYAKRNPKSPIYGPLQPIGQAIA